MLAAGDVIDESTSPPSLPRLSAGGGWSSLSQTVSKSAFWRGKPSNTLCKIEWPSALLDTVGMERRDLSILLRRIERSRCSNLEIM